MVDWPLQNVLQHSKVLTPELQDALRDEMSDLLPAQDLLKLPVARVLWKIKPDMATGAAALILADGAHHTGYSQNLTSEYLEDFAEMAGIEFVIIDADTKLRTFKNELR